MHQEVLDALMELRSPFALYENDLHRFVEARFCEAGLVYEHEAKIGAGCRIDYLVGDVGVEIKKSRPVRSALMAQLSRYAACDKIGSIIVVTQRALPLPPRVGGKRVSVLSLNALWGVALP